jgi:hypothetical protein
LRLKILIVMTACLAVGSTAFGQYSAQLIPAETVLKGNTELFTNVGAYDDAMTFIGGARRGVGGYTDAGVRMGFVDFDKGADDGFLLAGDLRYQIMELRIQDPLDLSVGGSLETILGVGTGNISLGGFVVGSRPIALTNDKDLWPYGRLVMRWDKWSDHNEFNIGLNLGSAYELNPTTRVSAEFQFDDQFGFIVGVAFGL